jgi:hypothetical protein
MPTKDPAGFELRTSARLNVLPFRHPECSPGGQSAGAALVAGSEPWWQRGVAGRCGAAAAGGWVEVTG